MEITLLMAVSAEGNHNKYYYMVPGTETFTVKYGRYIGGTDIEKMRGVTKVYPISCWQEKLQEKIKKGYVDITPRDIAAKSSGGKFAPEDKEIAMLIADILDYSRKFVAANYNVSANIVTPAAISKADAYIKQLSDIAESSGNCANSAYSVDRFNDTLEVLFCTIPRAMGCVSDFMAQKSCDFTDIIDREVNALSVLKTQAAIDKSGAQGEDDRKSFTETFGLSIAKVSGKELEVIRSHAGSVKVAEAYAVRKEAEALRYEQWKAKHGNPRDRFVYHGTRSENVAGILSEGLKIAPKCAQTTGHMFGYFAYFAPSAHKSYGYTSCRGTRWARGSSSHGYMFVYKVAYTNPLRVYDWKPEFSGYTEALLKKKGYDCFYADSSKGMLLADELMVPLRQTCLKYILRVE